MEKNRHKEDKLKVGILTFHKAYNYGACLQTYALQKAIDKFGFLSEVIDYQNQHFFEIHKISRFCRVKYIFQNIPLLFKPMALFGKLRFFLDLKIKYIKYDNFIKNNLKLSSAVKREELEKLNPAFDYFVTGSDQVWNLALSQGDTSYMLDFVEDNRKKKSYAASFGKDVHLNIDLHIYDKYLTQYSKLLVREKSAQDILKINGLQSEITLDPVLLHSNFFWNKIISKNNKFASQKYVVMYFIQKQKNAYEIAQKIGNDCGIKILNINNNNFAEQYENVTNLNNLWPVDFLAVLANAEHIITTSFHGLAFSLLFNKSVYYELSKDKENTNIRLEYLASLVWIKNREIKSGYTYDTSPIIWKNINKILETERAKSLRLLLSAFR